MLKRILAVILAVLMLCSMLVLAGCDKEPSEPETPVVPSETDMKLTSDELPIIDGATALAPYYEAMAAKLLGVSVDEARQYTLCSTTSTAFENLANKEVDMIFCAMPSQDQIDYAAQLGVEYEYYAILNGGFVFFVNKQNPVDNVTTEQLHDIYAGKITNWSELGGDNTNIIAYQRSEGSGSQSGLYRYIIPQSEVMAAPTNQMIGAMDEIVDAVAGYENSKGAIGYSYYYYVTAMHASDQIKLLSVDGVEVSDETIADSSYPLVNQSFIIIRKDTPEDSVVRDIVEWCQSEAGQQLGEENGYVRNAGI